MRTLSALCALVLLGGCDRLTGSKSDEGGGDGKGSAKDGNGDSKDAKAEEDGGDDANAMKVADDGEVVEGPVPPETSMVFFAIENELMPLGCFDKDKKSISSGEGCLAMVKDGTDVRLASHDSQYTRKVTGRVEPSCLGGS